MRLVLVEWVDSYGCSPRWGELEDCSPQLLTCKSVGWLLRDGEDCKVVVPHVGGDVPGVKSQGCGEMTIPTSAIVRMVDLAEPATL